MDTRYTDINKVYHAYSESFMKALPSNYVNCSIWSPPYHVGKNYEKGQTFEGWKQMLNNIISEHSRVLKPGGFMIINIADILCFPDEEMPRIQLLNPGKQKVKLTREEILEAKSKYPDYNRNQLAKHFGCSEQTIDRRLNGNNIRGGKHVVQTRVELVGGYLQDFARDVGLYLYDRKIWKKDPSWANSRWTANSYKSVDEFEYLYVFWKPGENVINKEKLTRKEWTEWGSRAIWEFKSVRSNNVHEAMFPIELPRRCILLYSELGDIILDPFMGSGTTAIAAIKTERHFIGIEKELKYVELSNSKIEEEKKKRDQLKINFV